MSTINDSDYFLVERSGTQYKVSAENLMSTIQDSDLMIIARGNTQYKVTCADVRDQLGGASSFNCEFLVIGGGGLHANGTIGAGAVTDMKTGGGAGGYISSVYNEFSGGGSSSVPPATMKKGGEYNVVVGGVGSDSRLSGTDITGSSFDWLAKAGGNGSPNSVGGNGASGGGGGEGNAAGSGTANQGFAGGPGAALTHPTCTNPSFFASTLCVANSNGGGGGAGGPARSFVNDPSYPETALGGPGVKSTITGEEVWYAAGGTADILQYKGVGGQPTNNPGDTGYGAGGGANGNARPGVVILKYPAAFTISNPGGGLSISTTQIGTVELGYKVSTITSGSGKVSFS